MRTKNEPSLNRLLNIARRMLEEHEVFYASGASPHMTEHEYQALLKWGFSLQSEHPHPPELHMYYAIRDSKYGYGHDEKNRAALIRLRTEVNRKL